MSSSHSLTPRPTNLVLWPERVRVVANQQDLRTILSDSDVEEWNTAAAQLVETWGATARQISSQPEAPGDVSGVHEAIRIPELSVNATSTSSDAQDLNTRELREDVAYERLVLWQVALVALSLLGLLLLRHIAMMFLGIA